MISICYNIWVGVWIFFNLQYMIWYLSGMCLIFKNDQKIWMWLKMSDQIFLVLVNTWYMKKTGMWTVIRLFSLHHWYDQYQRLWEMTNFDWCMNGMWQAGICITYFFLVVAKGTMLSFFQHDIWGDLGSHDMWLGRRKSFRRDGNSHGGFTSLCIVLRQKIWYQNVIG